MTSETQFRRQLDWNLLKVFQEIVAAGGVSRASHELLRKQPALSLALKRLEGRLDARLCERGPQGFTLTAEGEAVARICEDIARMVGTLPERTIASGAELRGRVRLRLISSVQTTALDRALMRFHRNYPMVEIGVGIGPWEGIADDLLAGELDAGVGPVRFQHADLVYDLLFNEIQRVYCGPAHHLYGQVVSELNALSDEPFVLKAPGEPDEIMRFRMRHGLGRQVAAYADHVDEMRRLTRLGVGVAFLPVGAAADAVADGRLWCLTPATEAPSIAIYVISNASAPSYRPRELMLAELRLAAQSINSINS